jgi:hypothetical protein
MIFSLMEIGVSREYSQYYIDIMISIHSFTWHVSVTVGTSICSILEPLLENC